MSHPFRKLLPAIVILSSVVITGVAGYMLIEKWDLLESVYMAVTTIFTVGFQEVRPLSPAGKIFTMILIVGGVGSAIYAAGQAVEIIVEGEMTGYRKRKRMDKKIIEMKGHFIICGFGRVGHQVAQAFEASGVPHVIIDSKKETLSELEEKDVPSIIGDATSDHILLEAGIRVAKGLIACSDSDVANVYVTLSARVLNPALLIVARAGYPDTEKKLLLAGANKVISPYFISGVRMASLATRPITSDFVDLVTHGGEIDFSLYEIPVPSNSPAIHKSIGEFDIRRKSGALILAIHRNDGSFDLHPNAKSVIGAGDVLIAIGTQGQYEALEKILAR
jgi:voltage-gated potassium channel